MDKVLIFFIGLIFFSNIFSNEIDDKEIIFVYNAKSGFVNDLVDFAHKILSPGTYECNLCFITYGTFTMKKKWVNYIESLPINSIFTNQDKISNNEMMNVKFPAVFFRDGLEIKELISSNQINDLNQLEQLIIIIDKKLKENGMNEKKQDKFILTDKEWQSKLTPEEYHILREKGTERPFTGKYDKFYDEGIYKCAGCDEKLFISDTKYNSGCGWPAFYKSLPGKVEESPDNSFRMTRVEITCQNCGGHLGHVFNDGPEPTGLRYCVNSASLDFEADKND